MLLYNFPLMLLNNTKQHLGGTVRMHGIENEHVIAIQRTQTLTEMSTH